MSFTFLNSIDLKSQNIKGAFCDNDKFALDVLEGLSSNLKHIPSKYFYDDQGSLLFSEITQLEEYYPTRKEKEIFTLCKGPLASRFQNPNSEFDLVELGAGDGQKTEILLEEFLSKKLNFEYFAVDISELACRLLSEKLKKNHPSLKSHFIVGDNAEGLNWLKHQRNKRKLVLFLGSNIGNFTKAQSLVFLRVLWKQLNPGDLLLIGFDLKKDIHILNHAYDDSKGVTSKFNLNLLQRINNELGANFNLDNFQHFGSYNPITGAMESYLLSLKAQEVYIRTLEKSFKFDPYEPIHLEYSYKYLISDIEFLASETGHKILTNYFDGKKYFVDSLWEVKKEKVPDHLNP